MSSSSFKKYFSFYLAGLIILCGVLAYFTIDPFHDFIDHTFDILLSRDKTRTKEYFNQFGIWGPLAIIIFIILQMFLIFFPSWLPTIIAVLAYGFWQGVLISLTGILIASTIGYYVGTHLKEPILKRIFGKKKLNQMDFWIHNYSFGTVVLFRISPFLSNDGISFIAGMVQMGYKKYILATLLGIVPLTLAIAYFSESIETLKSGLYWVGGGGLIIYAVYIYLDYKKRKKNSNSNLQ